MKVTKTSTQHTFQPIELKITIESKEDMDYVDDVTNHADAEVTPLYEMAAPKAEVAPAGEYPPLPSASLWRDETGIRGYGTDPGTGPWYTAALLHAYVDADRAMRAQADSQPAPVLTSENGGDWTQPTTAALRLGDAMQLLCGGKRPPDDMVQQWLDNTSESLQEFAASNGPAWAQGIGLIDAALVMVDQPTEITAIDNPDRDHEHRTACAQRV